MERHRACYGARCGRKGGSTGTARSKRRFAKRRAERKRGGEPAGRTLGRARFGEGRSARENVARRSAGGAAKTVSAIVVLAVLGLALPAALGMQRAHADAIPSIGSKAYGTCYIENSWRANSQTYFNVSGFTGELSGAWAVSALECLDHTAAAPTYTNASYTATVTAVNVQEGWVEYSAYITPPDATDGVTKNEHGLVGYQHVGGAVRVKRSFAGGIELVKRSADESISGNNACYSLAGAAYGVYRDEKCTDRWFTMTTDAAGCWKTAMDVPVGTYWVREIAQPPGYALDDTAYRVTVQADRHARVNGGTVFDAPQVDAADALVCKHDGEMAYGEGDAKAQGGAALSHAQYTVNFYAGHRSESDTSWIGSVEPLRTWIMQTDERGIVSLGSGDGTFVDAEGRRHPYKVSGSDFYRDASGRIVLPLGTVTVQETAPPEGYLLPEGGRVYVRQVSSDGTSETVRTYLAPSIPSG